jgi:hypothetical protein
VADGSPGLLIPCAGLPNPSIVRNGRCGAIYFAANGCDSWACVLPWWVGRHVAGLCRRWCDFRASLSRQVLDCGRAARHFVQLSSRRYNRWRAWAGRWSLCLLPVPEPRLSLPVSVTLINTTSPMRLEAGGNNCCIPSYYSNYNTQLMDSTVLHRRTSACTLSVRPNSSAGASR